MGTQTFGKGSVQTILPLGNNTANKTHHSALLHAGWRSIQAKGIVPDILVEDPATAGQDNIFRLREADLDKHLINTRPADETPENASKNKLSTPATNGDTAKPTVTEFAPKMIIN